MRRHWGGLFGKSEPGFFKTILITQGVWGIFMIFVLMLATFQVFAYLLGFVWAPAAGVKLGVGFLMLAVAASVMIPLTILKMKYQRDPVSRSDVLLIILIMALVIFLLLKLKVLVPEIFTQATAELGRALKIG